MLEDPVIAWAQAEYAVLQKKYQAIKQQRMEELEALMTEQQQRVWRFTVHGRTTLRFCIPSCLSC